MAGIPSVSSKSSFTILGYDAHMILQFAVDSRSDDGKSVLNHKKVSEFTTYSLEKMAYSHGEEAYSL